MCWQMTAHPASRLAAVQGGGPSLGTCSCYIRPRVAEQTHENLLYFQQGSVKLTQPTA